MPPLKILITGGSGLIGQYLNIEFSKHFDILTLNNSVVGNVSSFNNRSVNITDFRKLKIIFEEFRPDVVFHTAGISNVQIADTLTPSEVFNINVKSTENIAQLCDKFNSKLFYTSTDLVYAGYRGSMLREESKLIPLSLYAETKLMGEIKIQETLGNFVILRTALLFGYGLPPRTNFFQQMVIDLKGGKVVNLFTDQFRTPLSLAEAASFSVELIKRNISGEIINFGGAERISRYELGEMVCELLKIDKQLLNPITMNQIPGVPIVTDVSMDTSKLRSFGIKQLSLQNSINNVLSQFN
jgi:dTDP-4-dehydrorhamnose reductase